MVWVWASAPYGRIRQISRCERRHYDFFPCSHRSPAGGRRRSTHRREAAVASSSGESTPHGSEFSQEFQRKRFNLRQKLLVGNLLQRIQRRRSALRPSRGISLPQDGCAGRGDVFPMYVGDDRTDEDAFKGKSSTRR